MSLGPHKGLRTVLFISSCDQCRNALLILEGLASTPVCAKACARESWENVNKAAFTSGEPTGLTGVLKGLQRGAGGRQPRGHQGQGAGTLDRGQPEPGEKAGNCGVSEWVTAAEPRE